MHPWRVSLFFFFFCTEDRRKQSLRASSENVRGVSPRDRKKKCRVMLTLARICRWCLVTRCVRKEERFREQSEESHTMDNRDRGWKGEISVFNLEERERGGTARSRRSRAHARWEKKSANINHVILDNWLDRCSLQEVLRVSEYYKTEIHAVTIIYSTTIDCESPRILETDSKFRLGISTYSRVRWTFINTLTVAHRSVIGDWIAHDTADKCNSRRVYLFYFVFPSLLAIQAIFRT